MTKEDDYLLNLLVDFGFVASQQKHKQLAAKSLFGKETP